MILNANIHAKKCFNRSYSESPLKAEGPIVIVVHAIPEEMLGGNTLRWSQALHEAVYKDYEQSHLSRKAMQFGEAP
jgi:hypothetical protein